MHRSTAALVFYVGLVLGVAVAGIAVWNVYISVSPNRCRMTYMDPSYSEVLLPLPEEALAAHPLIAKYQLFRYHEGAGRGGDRDGRVPALFIPGNAGSFRQVRSLGGVLGQRAAGEYNFYTVYFQEELSAFDGAALEAEVYFANHAIAWILSRGHGRLRPLAPAASSVLLVGHSMGGVVARACLSAANYVPGSIRTIVTLNSPHLAPAASLQRRIAGLYRRMHLLWEDPDSYADPSGPLRDLAVLTIAGGHRDTLIHSSLSDLSAVAPASHVVSALTPSVPSVWIEADHECILWCRQLVDVLAAALLSILDPVSRVDSASVHHRVAVFRRMFGSSPLPQLLFQHSTPSPSSLPTLRSVDPKLLTTLSAAFSLPADPVLLRRVDHSVYHRAIVDPSHPLAVVTNSPDPRLVLCASLFTGVNPTDNDCRDASEFKSPLPVDPQSGMLLASWAFALPPSALQDRPHLYLLFSTLSNSNKPHFFGLQTHSLTDQAVVTLSTPGLFSPTQLDISSSHPLLMSLALGPFSRFSPLQYQLSPLACSRDPSAPSHLPFLAPLALHWASSIEESVFILQPSETTSFRFHSDSGSSAAHILLIADPDCSYRLVLWRDLPGFCGQVWRSYSPALLSCTTVLSVITFLFGISRAETSSSLFSFSHSLKAACASSVVVIGLLLPAIDFCLGLFSASHLSIWPLLFPEQMGSPPHRAIPPFVLCVLVSISVAILFVLHCLFLIVTSCLSLLGRFISPQPLTSSALRIAVVSILATVLFHPSLGTIVALSHLLLVSALFPSGRSDEVFHHLESLFFLYFLPLLLLFPGLVVWGKNLAFLPFFNLIRLDFETLFAVICALHVYQTVACSSADLPTYRPFFAVWFAIVAAFFTPMCLVHIHHCLDLASVLGASFVFYDLSRIRNLNHPKKAS